MCCAAACERHALAQVSAVQTLPLPPAPSGFLPQLSTEPHSAPSSSVLAPQFICTASLAFRGLLLICRASLSPLCSLPAGHGWGGSLPLPFPRLPPGCRGFPSPLPRLLLLLGSLCELCSWCSLTTWRLRLRACRALRLKLVCSLLGRVGKGILPVISLPVCLSLERLSRKPRAFLRTAPSAAGLFSVFTSGLVSRLISL